MVENLGGDSDEDEGKTPTISVVIDEDVPPTEPNAENDQSEITSTTVEEAPSLVLEDHDYTGARSAGRGAPGWHSGDYSESAEPFPVLEGLESYIGEDDCYHQQQHPHYQRLQQHYGPTPPQRRLHADQSGRVTSSAALIHASGVGSGSGAYPVRAGIRQLHKESGGYGGAPIPVQARPIGAGPNTLPTVFNQRSGVTRTIRHSEYSSPMMRGPPAAVAYGRYSAGSPAHSRALISSSTSSAASNGSYQSMLAGDPSRAANDNAPAPLIVPSRGIKPIQRSRVGIPSRMPVNVAGQSPRKFYQVTTKGSAADYDHMHSYAKAAPSNADYETYSGSAGGPQYAHERGKPLALVKAGGGRSVTDDQSSTFIDVVAEEEAQNAKFFQRQSDAMSGGVLAKPRTSSFNEPHDSQGQLQHATPVKHNVSKEQILVVDSPQHLSQHDPLSVPQRYRSIDGSGVPQGLPQRHRLLSSQVTPSEYGANPCYAYTISPDNQEIFMSKQAQRPRGRPRGSRTISVGSHAGTALSRQQPHGGRPLPTAVYAHDVGGVLPYVSPTSGGGVSGEVCSSSGELDASGAAEFHRHAAASGEISSSQDHLHPHQPVPQQQKYVAHQTYMYQPQSGTGDFHRQQRHSRPSSAAVAPELTGLTSETSAGCVPPEFSHADAQILQHQQRLERQQQQLQAAQQQHNLSGQQAQYQSLEDLADLAQLSQQQQHFISAAGQRPVYADSEGRSIYTSQGEPIATNKLAPDSSYHPDGSSIESCQPEQHQRLEALQQHANGKLMHQLDDGDADAVKQPMVMDQQPMPLNHHSYHNQPRATHISHSDSQLTAYYGHVVDSGYPPHAALNHHMMPNYDAPQPYLMTEFGEDGVTEFQASAYPPGHPLHDVAGHKELMIEKLKKQRKPRTPKDSEALAEKKREKKERKQKAEGEKTPRRPRKSKDTSELTPTLAGHSSEAHPPTVADTSASGLGFMAAVFETSSAEKSDKKRAATQRSARKLSAAVTGLTTADDTADSSSGDDADKDYGDYTTRCLCGMTHNDDFMIQCDKCDVWQHGVCMDVSAKHPPKNYFCEQCDPRMLKHTKQHAASIQIRVLARIQDNKRRSKSSKGDTPKSAIKNKLKFKPKRTARWTQEKQASPRKSSSVKDNVKPENQYSRGVRAFIVQQTTNFGDAHLLKTIKGQSALARQMFVANNVEGLVALLTDPDSTIPAGSAIIEYNGLFHMASESAAQSKSPSAKNTSSLRYCGFGEENAIIVDGSKFGSAARFARRSCKPNAVFRHVIHEGRLHLLLVSNEVVGFSQEITVPFDFDFTASPIPVSCACGSTDEQFGRENPTDCDIYKFNQALASLTSVASVAAKPAPSTASRSQSPAKAKKTKEESALVNEKETDGNRRRSARNAPERVESPAPEGGRKTHCAAIVADAPLSEKVEADERSQKSGGISSDMLPQKKAEEVRKTRSAPVTSKVESNFKPKRARDVASPKTKESEQSPEPRKTRSVVKQETPKVKEQSAPPEARKTRSAIKQKADAMLSSSSKATRTIFKEKEAKSPKAATSPAEVDKPKLSREDRKVQEAMAAFQRMEERQKQQQDKRKSMSLAVGVTEKHIKTEADMVKRSSLRLFSTSSASSSTSSVANTRSTRRGTVVEPKKEKNERTPVTSKASKRISSQQDKNDSPSKKRRLDEKQISHAEAAQLLTEMAFGIKAESDEDLKKDIHSKLRLAAEIALQHTPIKAQDNFSLASHLTVASRDDKSAAKRAREIATVTKSPASTSTRAVKSASKESAVANAKPEPKVERSTPKERAATSKEVETKVTTTIQLKEEAPVTEATPSSPAVERSLKRRVSENQKQIASTEFASQSSVKLSSAGTPVVAVTAAADSSVATAPATSSTVDSSDVTTNIIISGDGEVFKAAAGSPPTPSTPTKAVTLVVGGGSGVVLPSTIVTKSVKKLTLAEYKKRQSSSALSTPNVNTRQLRSSLLKPKRGFMPSLKDVSATSSSLSSPPSGLLEPNLSPRSAMFAAIPVSSPPAAPASSLRSLDTVVTPQVPSSSSQVGTPSIDELRRRIFGGKAKEDTAESNSRSAVVTPSSQPRMTLEERLKSQFGLGRSQLTNAESGASRYGSTAAVLLPPLPPRSMTTRARASPYDPYATSGGDPSTILVPPPPPPPSHSIHERR